MSGKIIKEEKIEVPIPGLEVTLETIEHPQFKTRKKVIFCLAELKAVRLGTLITRYHVKPGRKSDWEPIKYVPLYYQVKLTDSDVSEGEGEYDFDEKEEAMEFIENLRYKGASEIIVDTKADFERWKKGLKIFRESEKEAEG